MKGCLFFVGAGVVIAAAIAINFDIVSLPPRLSVTNDSGAQLQGLTVKAAWATKRDVPNVSNIVLSPQTIEAGDSVDVAIPTNGVPGFYPMVSFSLNGQAFEEELIVYMDASEPDLEIRIDSSGNSRVVRR